MKNQTTVLFLHIRTNNSLEPIIYTAICAPIISTTLLWTQHFRVYIAGKIH